MPPELVPGAVVWAELGSTMGREQAGRRPIVVAAGTRYLDIVDQLVIVLPITGTARGWPNHVPVRGSTGLRGSSWAMTEQVRTIDRGRLGKVLGSVSDDCLAELREWLGDHLDFELGLVP